ncbi:MAG: four helix bundle protein [Roseivirga sp.]
MATIERFEDLNAWQESRILANEIFDMIIDNDQIRDYPFKDQINRSSGSTMDNIAEGFDRKGNKEFRQFLNIAHGSNGEVKSQQLYRALDRKYLNSDQFDKTKSRCENISKMIGGLIKYLNNTDYSGTKFMVEEPPIEYGQNEL